MQCLNVASWHDFSIILTSEKHATIYLVVRVAANLHFSLTGI